MSRHLGVPDGINIQGLGIVAVFVFAIIILASFLEKFNDLPILERMEHTYGCTAGRETQLSTRHYKDGSIGYKVNLTGEECDEND